MGLKRLILSAWLAGIIALPIVSLEARQSFKPADSNSMESLEAVSKTFSVPEPVSSLTIIVDLVARNLSEPVDGKAVSLRYERHIEKVAEAHGVPPALVMAVIHAESGFNPRAVSPKGAVGLMQVMPATSDMVGIEDPFDPNDNIRAGVRYLKDLLKMFDGNETLAVAAYNSGPNKVKKYGGVPPFKETRIYIERVLMYYRSYLNL